MDRVTVYSLRSPFEVEHQPRPEGKAIVMDLVNCNGFSISKLPFTKSTTIFFQAIVVNLVFDF